MNALLVVSDHDREVMCAALRHVGYATITIVHTPDEISADAGSYDIAVVQLYHGDPFAPPDKLTDEDMIGVNAIRAICTKHPQCPVLAITDSRINGDAQVATGAGADWFQSVNWADQVSIDQILGGQIEHAQNRRLEKLCTA